MELSSDPLMNGLLHLFTAGAQAAISVGKTEVMQPQREKQSFYALLSKMWRVCFCSAGFKGDRPHVGWNTLRHGARRSAASCR